jgi:pimeloyl-ACP methyl ester carboxylesterase
MAAETKYALSGDVSIAYQVDGQGPIDLVVVPGWVSNVDVHREEPAVDHFYRRLASFSRVIAFDKRGTGLSDRVADLPSLEVRMDDVRAVLDAVGSERAALFGYSEGGPMSALFAATYPQRTSASRYKAAEPPYSGTANERYTARGAATSQPPQLEAVA